MNVRLAGVVVAAIVTLPFAASAWAQSPPARGTFPGELTAPPLPAPLPAQGGEVYRSIDESGSPSFSQTPPAGRPSQPMELRPLSGSIEAPKPALRLPPAPAAREAAPAPAGAEPPARASDARRGSAQIAPRGMSFETFIRIRRGMSEGELISRAGPPDHRGEEVNRGLLQESWYYLPTGPDPFTTIIQLRGGRVVNTERIRQL
ncbi:MAG: hypothetical protein ACK5TE_17795 [Pseudomonadota bacterium]|jgi:hypothetical protein